jgi:hypothetical protein
MSRALLCACVLALVSASAWAAEGWPTELKGDGLVVRFGASAADEASGVIIRGDKQFAFEGDVEAGKITGEFTVGEDDFEFTLEKTATGYVFKSGNKTYALTAVARGANPLDVSAPNPLDEPGVAEPDPQPRIDPKPVPQPNPAADARSLIYTPQAIKDPKSTLEVADVLVPRGWQVDSRIAWQVDRSHFVTNASSIFDPRTGWGLQLLPFDHFQCLPGTYKSALQQRQSLITIAGFELCGTVPTPQQYITEILIPRYRPPGLKVIAIEDLPDVSKALAKTMEKQVALSAREGIETRYGAAKARVEYVMPKSNNLVMEEDIYCLLEVTWPPQANAQVAQQGFPDAQWWLIRPVATYSFIAPKGQLKQATPVLQTIYSSIRIKEKWFAYTEQIAAFIRQKNLDDAKLVAATRAEINETQRAVLNERWDQSDKIARTTGHLLAGTMPYTDPNKPDSKKYVLEQKYDHWINDEGNIFSSTDPSITPEGAGWRKMKTAYPD